MTRWIPVCMLAVCVSGVAQDTRFVPGNGTINQPGSYRLNNNNVRSIMISANDVTLDLGGFAIEGPGGKSGTGIHISGVNGVEVRNGSIRDFAFGIMIENSRNVVVKGLRIRAQDLPIQALPPETGIMVVQSSNVVIENNAIDHVGLGIFVRGGMSLGNRIADNTVTAGSNGALGICFNPAPGDENGRRGTSVSGNVVAGFPRAIALSELSMANVVHGNTLAFHEMAIDTTNDANMTEGNVELQLP